MAGLHPGERWQLERGGRVLAELACFEIGMPWFRCRVEPVPDSGFEDFRSAADAAERALRAEDHDAVVSYFNEALAPMKLHPMHSADPIEKFLVWFEGDTARVRVLD